jgi:hypothetical protein
MPWCKPMIASLATAISELQNAAKPTYEAMIMNISLTKNHGALFARGIGPLNCRVCR